VEETDIFDLYFLPPTLVGIVWMLYLAGAYFLAWRVFRFDKGIFGGIHANIIGFIAACVLYLLIKRISNG
jgi:hypothetical protein